MKKKIALLCGLLLFICLCAWAQKPFEFVPSEWTTSDGGRVSASSFTYDDAAKTMNINASGTNNTCFMLDNNYSGKYFITNQKKYFLVKADKLDIGAGCSYIWWFNGYNNAGSYAPNYSAATGDGFYYVVWRLDNNANLNHYMDYTQDTILIANNNQMLVNAIGLTSSGSSGSTIYDINFYSIKEMVTLYPLLAASLEHDAATLQTLIDKAQLLVDNSTAASSLTPLISNGKSALAGSAADICDAVDALSTALDGFTAWSTLLDLIRKGMDDYNLYPNDLGSADFLAALNAAKESLNSSNAANVTDACTTLQTAYTQFELYHIPEAGIDITSYAVNPSFSLSPFSTSVDNVPTGWYIVIKSNGDTVRTSTQAKKYFNNWVGVNDYSTNAYRADCGTRVFGIWTSAIPAFQFSQTIAGLPDGSYTVKCWMAVGGGGGSRMVDQRLFAGNAEQLYSEVGQNNPGDDGPYYQLSVQAFVSDGHLTFGVRTGGGSSDGIGWYKVGNFTLTYHGLTAQFALTNLQDVVLKYLNDNVSTMVPGIAYNLDEQLQDSYDYVGVAVSDSDALGAYKKLLAVYEQTQEAVVETGKVNSLLTSLSTLVDKGYPGKLALTIAINKASEYLQSEDATYQGLIDLYNKLCGDRIAYIFSQEASSSVPASVTEVVLNPSFREAGQEDAQEATRTSQGWSTDNVTNGGDYTTYFNMGHTCFNSWSSNFTSMKLYQQLTGLPAGIYAVACKAITQEGCLNDQHAFIAGNISSSQSPAMTVAGWDNSGSYVSGSGTIGAGTWETLTTGKVKLGENGTLTIGFASTHNSASSNGSNGWFCVTDFELYYYGSEDASLFDARVAQVEAQRDAVTLKGDVASINSSITRAKELRSTDEASAYTLLDEAQSYAQTSVSAYEHFMTQYYDALTANATNAGSHAVAAPACAKLMAQVEALFAADTTHYAALNAIGSTVDSYNSYADRSLYIYDVYLEDVTSYSATYVEKLKNLIAAHVSAMSAAVLPAATVQGYLAKLNYALKDMFLSQTMVATGSVDLSFMIENPSFEADRIVQTSVFAPPTGWSILVNGVKCATAADISGNGLTGWCGCNTDGDETKTGDYIFGIWNAIIPSFEISQTLTGMPNGHYVLTVDMATPIDGGTGLSRLGGQRLFLNGSESYFKDYLIDEATGLGSYYEAETDRGPFSTLTVEANVTDNTLTLGVRTDHTHAHADSLTQSVGCGWFKIDNFTLKGSSFDIPNNWNIDTRVDEASAATLVAREFFDLKGVRQVTPQKGLNIVKSRYSDGSVKVTKMMMK